MPDSRNHDYYVFQDLDLLGNSIKNINTLQAESEENLIVSSPLEVTESIEVADTSSLKGVTTIGTETDDSDSENVVVGTEDTDVLRVIGKSNFENSISIGSPIIGDDLKSITISGIEIRWDATSNSLVFEDKRQPAPEPETPSENPGE